MNGRAMDIACFGSSEPAAYERQQHGDIADPDGAHVVVDAGEGENVQPLDVAP